MANRWGKNGNSGRFHFLGFKITVDGDCSHEIKRCLFLEGKAMTNPDSILKSKHITLLTKVCIVKAVVFPAIMYKCESWTIKKAEHWRTDAFKLWCWRRLLRVPWTARRYNQSILKEISPEYSLEGLMLKLKLQYSGHLMWRANSLEKTLILGKIEGRRRRGQQRMRWLYGITKSRDMSLRKFWKIVKDRKGWCDAVHRFAKHQTWLSNWMTTTCFTEELPWWLDGKESTWNVGHLGSIPESGRSPGEGNSYPLQYSCLEDPMDWGARQATVHGVTKSWIWLGDKCSPTHAIKETQ